MDNLIDSVKMCEIVSFFLQIMINSCIFEILHEGKKRLQEPLKAGFLIMKITTE